MIEVQQKELVLLPYPFSDMGGLKVRPALVVSNNILNNKSDDCLMVPLTTVLKEEPYSIFIKQQDLSSGKLLKESRIKVDKIFCVEKNLIIKKIGMLRTTTFDKVKQEILKIF
jgi:mRNA interferase MazF